MNYCTRCGASLEGTVNFCKNCGHKLDGAEKQETELSGSQSAPEQASFASQVKSMLLRLKILPIRNPGRFFIGFGAGVLIVTFASILIFSSYLREHSEPLTVAELLDLGEKYLIDMDYEKALVQFMRAIEIEPKNPRAYAGAAEAHIGLDDIDNAVSVLRLGFERLPNSQDFLLQSANVYEHIISIAPLTAEAYLDLAQMYITWGDEESAIAVLQRGLDALPDNAAIYDMLVDIAGITQEAPPSEEPMRETTPAGDIRAADPGLASRLDELAAEYNCVGVSLAVYDPHSGYSLYQYGLADIGERRLVDGETKFRVASLTKIATAILAMSLAENGSLDLDEDISVYLGYSVRNPDFPDEPITCRMLMQHTSSLQDTDDYHLIPVRTQLLETDGVFADRRPGESQSYANCGFIVLAAICENVSGKLINTLAREVLFDPLGIDAAYVAPYLQNKNVASQYLADHTAAQNQSARELLQADTTYINGYQHNYGAANLTISALDYAKILNLLINGGAYGGAHIISEAAVREMHNANVHSNPEYDFHYLQGLAVRLIRNGFMGEGVFYHTGSAYGTAAQFFYSIESGRIIVVLTTGSNSKRNEAHNDIKVCTEMSEAVWNR